MRTRLGWSIVGPLEATRENKENERNEAPIVRYNNSDKDKSQTELNRDFRRWCEGETLGVEPTSLCSCDARVIEESNFLQHARETVRRTDEGRMEVRLPWKQGFPACLPNNRHVAAAALQSLGTTLRKKGLEREYAEEMSRIIAEFAEEVPREDSNAPCWYLHHFVVQNPKKLRIVWNSAAEYQGFSLNAGLEKGPNLLNNLTSVVHNFRIEKIAFLGDIQKMFNQVQIAQEDRNYHRFIWEGRDFRWCRLPFGDKSAPDLSIYCLHYIANEHLESHPRGARIIIDQTYMDDIAGSTRTKEDAMEVIHEIDAILESGCFQVKGWHSNCKDIDNTDEPQTGILGMTWEKDTDMIRIGVEEFRTRKTTRRTALSDISSVWDPLGMAAPVLVEAKIFLQKLWDTTFNWDTELSDDECKQWGEICDNLRKHQDIKIPRQIGNPSTEGATLHVFCDAGTEAYGAAAWLQTAEGFAFVQAKTFVAPLKTKTVPRLELLSAQLATRMLRSIKRTLGDVEAIIWSDSSVVLQWIRTGAKKYKAFVAARLQEIHENVENAERIFQYVPSARNMADALTKSTVRSPEELQTWLKGPRDWNGKLEGATEKELTEEDKREMAKETRRERARRNKGKQRQPTQLKTTVVPVTGLLEIVESCTSWEDLIEKAQQRFGWSREKAINEALKEAQREINPNGLVQDEVGVLRIQGRLSNTDLPREVRFPALISGKSPITELIVKDGHKKAGHPGRRHLKNYLHSKFGVRVTEGDKIMSKIKKQCELCQRFHAQPHTPLMGELPKERTLINQAPFTAVGIDFAGKVNIIGKETGEVVLFTCLTTRVIHLELAPSKTTEHFIGAWRRFTNKRGIIPQYVLTDGAKSFAKARTEIVKEVNSNPITTTERALVWEIAAPRAPHRRGVIETAVKHFKNTLGKMTGAENVKSEDEWNTILAEITYLINERPLMDDETIGNMTAYTGNSILYPYAKTNEEPKTSAILRSANKLTKDFWETWYETKPAELFDRPKWKKDVPNIKEGDKVLIIKGGYGNKAVPRKYWPTGKVKKCIISKDKIVRVVLVELETGKTEKHAVQNLVIISELEGNVEDGKTVE